MPPDNAVTKKIAEYLDEKVIATALTGLIAGWIATLAAKYGYDLDLATIVVFVGPPLLALVSAAVGFVKRDPRFEALLDLYRAPPNERGDLTALERMIDFKAVAAAAATLVVGWVATFAAKYGFDVDLTFLTSLIAPLVLAGISLGVGYFTTTKRAEVLLKAMKPERPEPDEGIDPALERPPGRAS